MVCKATDRAGWSDSSTEIPHHCDKSAITWIQNSLCAQPEVFHSDVVWCLRPSLPGDTDLSSLHSQADKWETTHISGNAGCNPISEKASDVLIICFFPDFKKKK